MRKELAELLKKALTKAHSEIGPNSPLEENCSVRGLIRIFPDRRDDILQVAASHRHSDGAVFTDNFMDGLKDRGFKVEEKRISPVSTEADSREFKRRVGEEAGATLHALQETAGRGGILMRFTFDPERHLGHAESFTAEDLAKGPNGKRNQNQVGKLEQMIYGLLVGTNAKRFKIWRGK